MIVFPLRQAREQTLLNNEIHILDEFCSVKFEGLLLVIPSRDRHNLPTAHLSRPLQRGMAQPSIYFSHKKARR